MMWRALRSAVVMSISAIDTPIISILSAANWLAPAKTTADIKRLSQMLSPAVFARMPKAIALGTMPMMTGRDFFAPAEKPPVTFRRPAVS